MIITLKDGSTKEYSEPKSIIEIAADISEGLARMACAGEVNGEVEDLRTVIDKDCNLSILTFNDEGGKAAFRHTTSHIMAQAIKRLYPETKLAIGPSIADGFYYDIDRETPLTSEDLEKIEAEMKKIVKEDLKLERFELPRAEAIAFMKEKEEPYKVELIEDLPEDAVISFYRQGEFTDLCAGPHLMSTKPVKAFKLTSLAGAYWRGSEKNKMLQRIYGTAFTKKAELEEYLHMIEEAKKRDHRKLGKELGLFMMSEDGPGFPFFLPKGMDLKNALMDYWREIHRKAGYVEISTPIILNRRLWETSGHWDHYKENMYTTVIDDEDYAIKPMNCPGHIQIFNSAVRSYRDLPIRYGEFGACHRNEPSGSLHGLMRVRGFTQDDGHIFCTEDQILSECTAYTKLVQKVYADYGFTDISYKIATRPEKRIGDDATWDKAEKALMDALDASGIKYDILPGEGAFYGPKIEYHLRDSLGRGWQCGTIQVDFQMPARLGAEYVTESNGRATPVMLHRAIVGSLERFIGMLLEHYAGQLPPWLAPVQVAVANITDDQADYAKEVVSMLKKAGLRAEADLRNGKITYKIRELSLQKLPYILVVGAKEKAEGKVAVRVRGGKDLGAMSVEDFIKLVQEDVATRRNVNEIE